MDPVRSNPVNVSPGAREEFERTASQLAEPLFAHFSPGNARVRLTATGAYFSDAATELEGFSRVYIDGRDPTDPVVDYVRPEAGT